MTGILLTLVSRGSTTLAYTVSPVISGTATERSVLTTTNGVWLGAVPITYSYQWFSNGAPVASGSTSYTVQTTDLGNAIYCRVSATNFYGTIVAQSASTGIVSLAAPTAPVVTVSGLTTTEVTLNWQAAQSNVTGYDVYLNTAKITLTPLSTLSFKIPGDTGGTKLLINGNGTSGGTDYIDYSPVVGSLISLGANGAPTINTTTKKFETGSLYFDGANALLVGGNKANQGTNDFTIEFWLNTTTTDTNIGVINTIDYHTIAGSYNIILNASSPTATQNKLTFWNNGNVLCTTSDSVNNGVFNHIAIVRNGTSIKIYFNGVVSATATVSAALSFGAGQYDNAMLIGCQNMQASPASYQRFLVGYLDDIRVSTSAKYLAAFTPPSIEFNTSNAASPMTAQTSYTYYVKAINSIGTTSSLPVNIITDANAPTGLTQSSMTSGGFTLSWTVTSNVSYTIFNGSTQIGDPQTTGNVAITGLSAQTPYTFYVKATSTGSTNAVSSAGYSITTAPAAPTGLSATAIGQNGFTLNWTGIAGLTYQILNNASSVVTGIVGTNGAMSYNVTGLSTYRSYPSFYVKASNVSNGVTSTTQSSPLSVQTTKATLTLSGAFGNSANVNTINNAYLTSRGLSNSVPTDIYITNMYASMSSSNLSAGIPIVVEHPLSGTASGTTLTMTVDAGYSIQGRAGTYSTTNMNVLAGGAALFISYAAEHGRINLINKGTIAAGGGVGGRGGGGARPAPGDVGQPGGDAIYINNGFGTGGINLYITNNGNIYGGGGGGGGGGCGTGTGSTSASSPSGASNWTGGSGTQGSQSPGYGLGGSGGGAGQAGFYGSSGDNGAGGGAGGAAGRAIMCGYTSAGFNWVTQGNIVGSIVRL